MYFGDGSVRPRFTPLATLQPASEGRRNVSAIRNGTYLSAVPKDRF
jgi:hypothetical protein